MKEEERRFKVFEKEMMNLDKVDREIKQRETY
jgi:hypothetical protein